MAEMPHGLGIYDGTRTTSDGTSGLVSRAVYDIQVNSRRSNHYRSTSGTSQFSTATSASGGGQRTGSFVHPFQQTPRPYTPPIAGSYQNSIREDEGSDSPAWTEDDEERFHRYPTATAGHPYRSGSALSSRHNSHSGSLTHAPNTSPLLPSAPLRVQTKHLPASSSRLYLATSQSDLREQVSQQQESDLYAKGSSLSSTPQFKTALFSTPSNNPSVSMSPISPAAIRSSIDKGFRLRSKSDASTALSTREVIQKAREDFEERERLKDERIAREEQKAAVKKNQREVKQQEKYAKQRRGSAATSRKDRSTSDLSREKRPGADPREGHDDLAEFPAFSPGLEQHDRRAQHSRVPEEVPAFDESGIAPGFENQPRSRPRRRSTTQSVYRDTKKKTHSAWTRFMMWLRTRLMRMRSS